MQLARAKKSGGCISLYHEVVPETLCTVFLLQVGLSLAYHDPDSELPTQSTITAWPLSSELISQNAAKRPGRAVLKNSTAFRLPKAEASLRTMPLHRGFEEFLVDLRHTLGLSPPPLVAEAPHLEMKAPQSVMEVPQVRIEAPQLTIEAPQMEMGVQQPAMEPQLAATEPPLQAIEAPQLAMEAPQPAMGVPQPSTGAPQPAMEASQPAMGAPQLAMEALQPAAAAEPLPDEAQPMEIGAPMEAPH